jgi:hypothetical protein
MAAQHRSNFSRERVSDGHWEMVRCDREAEWLDREAYEREIEVGRSKVSNDSCGILVGPSVGQASSKSTYIFKLEGLLDRAAKLQDSANLEEAPAIVPGAEHLGDAIFIRIDSTSKRCHRCVVAQAAYWLCGSTRLKITRSSGALSL